MPGRTGRQSPPLVDSAEEQQLSETTRYALIMALTGAVAFGAVLANRLSARLRIPAPVWMLAAAAVAVQLIPGTPTPPEGAVEQSAHS